VHVAFLKKALGSAAVKKPKFDFKGTNNTNQKTFEATAQLLEDTGVSAHLGQVANIKTPAIAAAAGTIVTVEARHAAWMRHIRQTPPAPSSSTSRRRRRRSSPPSARPASSSAKRSELDGAAGCTRRPGTVRLGVGFSL